MQSVKLILPIATASLALICAACSHVPTATGCSELARPILTRDIPHVQLGDTGDAAMDWQLYGVAETGQLNRANDDKRTGFAIINACEARDAEARERLERPWWQVWS